MVLKYTKGVAMTHVKKRGLALACLGLALVLFISACISVAPRSTQSVQLVYPTVLITQYVTQIVATPTITPPPPPTPAVNQTPSTVNVGWDPFTVQIYYPVVGCVASRLHVGDVAYVANGSVDLLQSKDLDYSPAFRELAPGEMVDIIKGAWCSNGSLIWKVATSENEEGFAAEGNGEIYWLLPMPPGTESVVVKVDKNDIFNTLNVWLRNRFHRDPRD
jgi:hypothetical protein